MNTRAWIIMRKTSVIVACAVFGLALALVAVDRDHGLAAAQARSATVTPRPSSDATKQLALLKEIFDRIRTEYVDKTDDTKLVEAAIAGMLGALDPHSEYMNQKAFDEVQAQTHGEFGGVGIRVVIENGQVKVSAPIPGTPAARAGILADDIITHLDGEPLQGFSVVQVAEKMRGPSNTTVRLSVMRAGRADPLQLEIVRDTIRVPSVYFHREGDDVGYVRVTRFNYQTTEGLREAIRELSGHGAPGGGVKSYVLDLRNNPGGLIDQAVSVASSFLDTGEVVSLRGREQADVERFDARSGRGDLTKGKRLIVLINGGSASSAEIVAGALQDHRRAIILGTRSYGKGSVQTIIPLGHGNGALRLTSARYFTPSGRSIQAQGIVPDIEVSQAPRIENGAAEAYSEATLRGHLKGDGEEHSGSQSYVPSDPAEDRALQKALSLLHGARLDAAVPTTVRTPVTAN
jgi:carboxyl-terminal processing protease